MIDLFIYYIKKENDYKCQTMFLNYSLFFRNYSILLNIYILYTFDYKLDIVLIFYLLSSNLLNNSNEMNDHKIFILNFILFQIFQYKMDISLHHT